MMAIALVAVLMGIFVALGSLPCWYIFDGARRERERVPMVFAVALFLCFCALAGIVIAAAVNA